MQSKSRSSVFLCLVAASSLPACQTLAPASTPPTPPTVDCQQGKTESVPAFPAITKLDDAWVKSVYLWSNKTLGILTKERQLRTAENGCLAELRKRGVIQ